MAGALAVCALPASAALVWDLDYAFNGTSPDGTPPWARVTVTDLAGPSGVEIKIESLLSVAGNFIDQLGLSYSGPVSPSPALAEVSRVGTFGVDAFSFGPQAINGTGGETMNIFVDFNNNFGSRFDGSDSIIYSLNVGRESDFINLLPGNTWLVAAHVQGLGTGNQLSGAITGRGFEFIPVPEPATFVAGALLLLPFAAASIRRIRRG
jgi:hypothetical protein